VLVTWCLGNCGERSRHLKESKEAGREGGRERGRELRAVGRLDHR